MHVRKNVENGSKCAKYCVRKRAHTYDGTEVGG